MKFYYFYPSKKEKKLRQKLQEIVVAQGKPFSFNTLIEIASMLPSEDLCVLAETIADFLKSAVAEEDKEILYILACKIYNSLLPDKEKSELWFDFFKLQGYTLVPVATK